jgi:hypothetical protein
MEKPPIPQYELYAPSNDEMLRRVSEILLVEGWPRAARDITKLRDWMKTDTVITPPQPEK